MKKSRIILPLACFLIVVFIFKYVIFIGYVPSESMEPTIPAGSKIIGVRLISELNNGDIIVFEQNNEYIVKRIAASPGETVKNSTTDQELVVPENCYYVLGDNSSNSYDSRYWQDPFVKYNNIIAKLFVI